VLALALVITLALVMYPLPPDTLAMFAKVKTVGALVLFETASDAV